MNLGAILLLAAVLVVVVILISRPFLDSHFSVVQTSLTAGQDHTHSSLLAEKERLLSAIQELEFDHETGKISDDLFPGQRTALMKEAARVMARLEMEFPGQNRAADGSGQSAASSKPYDELEEMIAKRKLTIHQKSTGFCPHCGKAILENDRFCPKCGSSLQN